MQPVAGDLLFPHLTTPVTPYEHSAHRSVAGRAEAQAVLLEGAQVIAAGLRARQVEIAQAIYERIREAVPDPAGVSVGLAYQEGVLAAVDSLVTFSLENIDGGDARPGSIPTAATAQARRAARAGVGLGTVLRRYVAGHRRLGEFVAEEAARVGLAQCPDALDYVRRKQEELLEHLTAAIELEYDCERDPSVGSLHQRRAALVRGLLEGGNGPFRAEQELGYQLDAWHIGLILTGTGARAALEKLSSERQLLEVPREREITWAWLGCRQAPTHSDMERLCQHSVTGVSIAMGEPGLGVEGWRRTHQQARQVAFTHSQDCARYADVAMLTHWLAEPDRGLDFVEIYLGRLSEQKDGGAASRQALSAYFAAKRNVVAAAQALGVERRTLSYRLQVIEGFLGYRLEARMAELEVALRLHRALTAAHCTDRKKSDSWISTLA